MAKYKIGEKVTNVNSHEKGVIISVLAGGRGRQLYRVSYAGIEKDTLETNLIQDTDLSDPFECMKQSLFASHSDFARLNTTFKIQNTSNNTISTLKASKTIFKAYQFKPLLKFLNSDNRRILVADEVGLGKTIEAGHIMMELYARRELKNVLVICPKSLCEKWKNELKDKFNFNFKIYENKNNLADDLSIGTVKAIINYEKLRKPKEKENGLLKLVSEKSVGFDLVLCDEAHRLRNKNTRTYIGAEELFTHANAAVLLTATPIMISEENLFNLMHLLDKEQFDNREIFQSYLSMNKPFVKAMSQLNNDVALKVISEELKNAPIKIHYGSDETYFQINSTVDKRFTDVPLYQKIIQSLDSGVDTLQKRVELQFDISSMSMMNNIFSRTRKRDITTDWTQAERMPHTRRVLLNSEERKEFDEVIDQYIEDHTYVDEYGDSKLTQGHTLGLIQKKRRVSSSIYGYLNSEESLNAGIDEFAGLPDAKFEALLQIVKEVVEVNGKKLIVFALFKNTLKYLSIRLNRAGFKSLMIHGDISERDVILRDFKRSYDGNILLSSEVGSEGLDLQFCDALVNYDLPWNPMVVEQRIGRIDRFGQKSPVVNIYNIIVSETIQEEIYDRLLDRIGIFRFCIGDLEAILDKETETGNIHKRFTQLERELYCQELNEKQREDKIASISRAILVEKQHLEEINEGLSESLTNDIYFKNEIERIERNFRYLTETELHNFMQVLIREKLPQMMMTESTSGIYELQLPLQNPNYLVNFLIEHQPSNDSELDLLFKGFINAIRGEFKLNLTYNQQIAYDNSELIHVNAYHPIVLAAKEYFASSSQNQIVNKAFNFSISQRKWGGDLSLGVGTYVLGVYVITVSVTKFGKKHKEELMTPIVYNVSKGIIVKDMEFCERLLGESQLNAEATITESIGNKELIDLVRSEFATEIDDVATKIRDERSLRIETSRAIQTRQTIEFYENRLKSLENNLDVLRAKVTSIDDAERRRDVEKVLPALIGLIQKVEAERDDAILRMSNSDVSVMEPTLLSLSVIHIQ